jgi:diguanylate cyclase (GGDEF)-like protein
LETVETDISSVLDKQSVLGKKPEERSITNLPKQISLPSLRQLQNMLAESLKEPGHTTQLPFGDAPEELSLAVFKDRGKGDYHWALYRGDQGNLMLVWEQVSPDPAFIHQLITAQFPALEVVSQSQQAVTQSFDSQATSGRMRSKATLEGNLENMQMPNVLQSVGMSKGTGRLEVETPSENATVYFDDGNPIHCVLGSLEGSSALIELVGWEEGEFRFYPEAKFETVTIKKRLDMMLMEGAALDDQRQLLKQKNIHDESYLLRNHPSITEQLFEQLLEKGTGADMALQKRMYQLIDSKSRLIDILRKCNVSKQKWVPIIFNFATCNLVTFVDELPDSSEKPMKEADIDWSQAREAERSLLREDTGIFSQQAFLFLLEREFHRFERFGRPVSVILLELYVRAADPSAPPQPLPAGALREVADRVNKMKRKTDLFAHYDSAGFALILPETESTSARNFAGRMAEMLMTTPLSAKFGGSPVIASVGVGSIPDDCPSLGAMMALAKPARPQ